MYLVNIPSIAKEFLVSQENLPIFLQTVHSTSISFKFVEVWKPSNRSEAEKREPPIPLEPLSR